MSGYREENMGFHFNQSLTNTNQIGLNSQQTPHLSISIPPMGQGAFQAAQTNEVSTVQVHSVISTPQAEQTKKVSVEQQRVQALLPTAPRQGTLSHRRKRTVYSQSQLSTLEKSFHKVKYPDIHQREYLAKYMQLPECKIQVWFQNRRAKAKRQKYRPGKCQTSECHVHRTSSSGQQRSLPRNAQQGGFQQYPGAMPCSEAACTVTRHRNHMQSAAFSNTFHRVPHTSPCGNQKNSKINVAPVQIFNEEVEGIRRSYCQMPLHVGCSFDNVQPNRTIRSMMNVLPQQMADCDAPGSPSGMNACTSQPPLVQSDHIWQKSPILVFDTDNSESSPESPAIFEGRFVSVLDDLEELP